MTAKEYIDKFKMGDIITCDKFDRPEFLKQLNEDFKELIQKVEDDHEISYPEFKDLVVEIEHKFREISLLKVGNPLTKKLWNAFYARFVIPHRAAYFPLTHRRILTLVEKRYRDKQNDTTSEV